MKRIITILLMLLYIGLFGYTFKNVIQQESQQLEFDDYTRIDVKDWEKNCDISTKLSEIKDFAIRNKVNIIRINYELDSNDIEAKYYCAIGNEEEFLLQLNIEEHLNLSKDWKIVNYDSEEVKDVYRIRTFGKSKYFYADLLSGNQNVVGTYLISDMANAFVQEMNFSTSSNDELGQTFNSKVGVFLLFLFLGLYCILYSYFVINDLKEIAICKLNGWSKKLILFRIFVKKQITIHIVAMMVPLIIGSVLVYFYNRGAYYVSFIMSLLKIFMLVMCLIMLLSLWIFGFTKFISIKLCILDKKPLRIISILNYVMKSILILGICILLLCFEGSISSLTELRNNISRFDTLNNYCVYNMDSRYVVSNDLNLLTTIGPKCRDLYEAENQAGGILAYRTDTIFDQFDCLVVNKNYLLENKIKDVNENNIIDNIKNPSDIFVFIPECHKKDESYLKEQFDNWFKNQSTVEKYLENNCKDYKGQDLSEIKIQYCYIKSEQALFTYQADGQMYIKNPIIVMVNGKNIGNDTFLTFIGCQSFFALYGHEEDYVSSMKEKLIQCGLEKEIKSVDTIGQKFAFYLNQSVVLFRFIIGFLVLIGSSIIAIVYFQCKNYLENNKYILSLKKVNGFGFWTRHMNYICMIGILYIANFFIMIILKSILANVIAISVQQYVYSTIIINIGLLLFEIVVVTILLHRQEKKKVLEIIKGL